MSPGRDMTEDDFRTLRDWGATLLRYQMVRDWGKIGANRDLAEYEAWLEGRLAHFESFVLPMCRKYGLKVVLDLHVTPGGRNAQGEFRMFFEREYADWFVDFWRRTAARFAPVVQTMGPVIYGYDLCNEPVQHGEALPECDWWSLQRRAAEAIREVDPETPVIVETNNWDVPSAFGMLSPLALVNVIYEVHVYNPIQFTHQGIMGHPMGVAYPNAARGWDREYLRRVLGPVRAFQEKHGAKIYVGEFSAAAWAPGADAYLRDCIALFNEYGWDWTYHAFRESPVWDVEKAGPRFSEMAPDPDTPRKRALREGFGATRFPRAASGHRKPRQGDGHRRAILRIAAAAWPDAFGCGMLGPCPTPSPPHPPTGRGLRSTLPSSWTATVAGPKRAACPVPRGTRPAPNP